LCLATTLTPGRSYIVRILPSGRLGYELSIMSISSGVAYRPLVTRTASRARSTLPALGRQGGRDRRKQARRAVTRSRLAFVQVQELGSEEEDDAEDAAECVDHDGVVVVGREMDCGIGPSTRELDTAPVEEDGLFVPEEGVSAGGVEHRAVSVEQGLLSLLPPGSAVYGSSRLVVDGGVRRGWNILIGTAEAMPADFFVKFYYEACRKVRLRCDIASRRCRLALDGKAASMLEEWIEEEQVFIGEEFGSAQVVRDLFRPAQVAEGAGIEEWVF
jgi:hypothetical protein